MKFFVKINMMESIHGDAARKLWEPIGREIGRIAQSKKFVSGAVLGGKRGAYFIFDVNSALELNEALGAVVLDNFCVEFAPLMEFKELGEFFEKQSQMRD